MNGIIELPEAIAGLERPLREAASRLFTVTRIATQPSPDSPRRWEYAEGGQRVVRVMNRWTYEEASFDEKRRRRAPKVDGRFEELHSSCESLAGCWFCSKSRGGKLPDPAPEQYCWIVDPKARFDGYHTVIVFTEHNPLRYTPEAAADYLRTGEQWARAALAQVRASGIGETAFYLFTWNSLCGSAVHGHAQVTLSPHFPYGRVALWAEGSRRYCSATGRNYFEDLWMVHQSLGLGEQRGAVRVMASLSPIKERECLLYVPSGEAGDVTEPLASALVEVLRTLQADAPRGLFAFNLAVYQPPLGVVPEAWEGFPLVVRVVDRGWPMLGVTDVASMELFGSSIVASDPLQLAKALRARLGSGEAG